jgi:hypothetical protein
VNIGLSMSATDNCGIVGPVAVAVFSDEDDDVGGSFSPDAKDIAAGTLRLRAEANKQGDGRVYLITAKAADSAGSVSYGATTVVVPNSTSAAALGAANAQGAAATSYFAAHLAPPPGFVLVGDGPVLGPKQ